MLFFTTFRLVHGVGGHGIGMVVEFDVTDVDRADISWVFQSLDTVIQRTKLVKYLVRGKVQRCQLLRHSLVGIRNDVKP